MSSRFPRKITVWVPDSIADGLELLAGDELLTVSDHARQAFRHYLTQLGAVAAPRPVNGQHHQPAE